MSEDEAFDEAIYDSGYMIGYNTREEHIARWFFEAGIRYAQSNDEGQCDDDTGEPETGEA